MDNMLLRSAIAIGFFLPSLAHAHGDDDVTVVSFIGPLIALLVFALVVSVGKMMIRVILEGAKHS